MQTNLFPQAKAPTTHGGTTRLGRRKTARPISTREPMHLVLRSSRATGPWNFLRHRARIHAAVQTTARRYGVKILRFENVGNHLHLLVQGKNRTLLQSFFRVLPQAIMFLVTGARKGNPQGRFFDHVFFSRVVRWGRDFLSAKDYLWKNRLEGLGLSRAKIETWTESLRETRRRFTPDGEPR